MASSLSGLDRTLTWTDFPRKESKAPLPKKIATAAYTYSLYSFNGASFQPIAGSRPAKFQLVDNVTVSATFDGSKSFVMSWVFDRPQQFQDDMLNHEQGHYNITALVSRDFYVDVMLLKPQTFAKAQDGIAAVKKIQVQSLNKIGKIQELYDHEVHPEQDSGLTHGVIQQNWDRFIKTAFEQADSTGTQASDGTTRKVRLVDVLTKNGKQI